MNYLGIDYGRVHVGLALSMGFLAEPYKSILVKDLYPELAHAIKEHEIKKIILGLPDGLLYQEVLDLSEKLKIETGLEVVLQDETLTTQRASELLRSAPLSKRRGPDHHYAAAIVLQDYLDSQPIST